MVGQTIGKIGKDRALDAGGGKRRPGAPAGGGWTRRRQPTRCIVGICCAHRDVMAAPREATRERVGKPRNSAVRPGFSGIRRHMENSQRSHLPDAASARVRTMTVL